MTMRFKRWKGLWRSWLGLGVDRLENPDILLDQAEREMEAIHTRNQEHAREAFDRRNLCQQRVDDLEAQREHARMRSEAARSAGDIDSARAWDRVRLDQEQSLVTERKSLAGAIETAQRVQKHLRQQRELIDRKRAEARQLKAQWRAALAERAGEQSQSGGS